MDLRVLFVALYFILYVAGERDKYLLRDVNVLTFHDNKWAASRRGYRYRQLECVGGSAMDYHQFHPRAVQCFNRGYDGHDVNWECKAELNDDVKFGPMVVNCEGFDHPDDKYVLKDSCSLRYELDLRYKHKSTPFFNKRHLFTQTYQTITSSSTYLMVILLIAAAFGIWYFCLRDSMQSSSSTAPPGFASGPSNYDCPNVPPPNYEEATRDRHEFMDDSFTRYRSAPAQPSYGWRSQSPPDPPTYKPSGSANSWLPTGLAAGAGFLSGYFMGSSSRTHTSNTYSSDPLCTIGTPEDFIINSPRHHRSRTPSPSNGLSSGFASTSRR